MSAVRTYKTEHPKDAVAEGFAVPGWAEPAEFPARRLFLTDNGAHILGWCMYLLDGRVEEISAAEAAQRIRGGI